MNRTYGWASLILGLIILGIFGIVFIPLGIHSGHLGMMSMLLWPILGIGLLTVGIGLVILFLTWPTYSDKNIQNINPYAKNNLSFTKIDLCVLAAGLAAPPLCLLCVVEFFNRFWLNWFFYIAAGSSYIGIPCYWIWSRARKEKLRTAQVVALANSIPGSSYLQRSRLHLEIKTPLTTRGIKRRSRNAISWEQNGQKIEIYDFLYYFTVKVKRGQNRFHTRKQERVVAQTIAKVSHESPVSFQLSPKSALNAVSEKFVGEKSIQFVDLPEFARKFSLQCEDEFAIKKIFDLEVREELLNDPGWSIEADGKHLVVYRDQELYKVEAWPELAERAIEFSRLLKVRDGIIR